MNSQHETEAMIWYMGSNQSSLNNYNRKARNKKQHQENRKNR